MTLPLGFTHLATTKLDMGMEDSFWQILLQKSVAVSREP